MSKHLFALATVFFLCCADSTLHAQSAVPNDFALMATAGGGEPWSPLLGVKIQENGATQITRSSSRTLDAETLSSTSLNLSGTQVQAIWDAINANQFFALAPQHTHATITGRTYARLTVQASGSTHTVTTRNIALTAFDNIVTEINSHLPAADQLVYDTSEPVPVTPTDLCEQSPLSAPDRIAADELLYKRDSKDLGEIPERRPEPARPDVAGQPGAPHPGTMVACELNLDEAAAAGLVDLQAKGELFYGDAVSIMADNTNPQTCDEITVRLYLEFYGAGANFAQALQIAARIQSYWNGFTNNLGQMVNVFVDYRVSSASTPPGTPGYHQIELTPDLKRSYVDEIINPNDGSGGGEWASGDDGALYAHEAGHLMGFVDQYEDYVKLPNDTWQHEAGGPAMSPEEFAAFLDPKVDKNFNEILTELGKPEREVVSVPLDGHENDLMATTKGQVLQQDINELTQNIGLSICIPPGSVLVPREASEQNLVVTRQEYLFVPPGGTAELHGIYVACLDYDRGMPDEGRRFDVAPHLSGWNGFPETDVLLQALAYADTNDRFCENDFPLQSVVWRVTDNQFNTTLGFYLFVLDAGIQLDSTMFEFPEIVNPDQDSSAATGAYVPRELYTARVTPRGTLVVLGEHADVSAVFTAPVAGSAASHTATWALLRPANSSATLANSSGVSNNFIPDVRGIYKARYLVEVSDAPGEPAPFVVTSTGGSVIAPDDLTETFESGVLNSGAPFYWKGGGSEPWVINRQTTHTGIFSASSGSTSDDGLSTLSVKLQMPAAGNLEFAARTSSEKDYDYLVFLVDGQEVERWSGELPWFTVAFELSEGEHLLTWQYQKDGSVSDGADKAWVDDVFFPEDATLVTSVTVDEPIVPSEFALFQNYPNPFNPSTTITYVIPQAQHVTLVVYNALGQQVAILVEGQRNPGQYQVQFDAGGLSNGVYYYELRAGTFTQRKAMVLLK